MSFCFCVLSGEKYEKKQTESRIISRAEGFCAKPGDEYSIDLAAVATIDSKGEAYALDEGEMPDGKPLAAIYRY
jgi:hypothetical protein